MITNPEIVARLSTTLHVSLLIYGAICVINIADMVDAIVTSRTLGRTIESAKLRHALFKLSKYWLCMIFPLMFDAVCALLGIYSVPFFLGAVALIIILIEGWSMVEHAKCRRDRTAKIPEVLRDLASYVGEDELHRIVTDMLHRAVETKTSATFDVTTEAGIMAEGEA